MREGDRGLRPALGSDQPIRGCVDANLNRLMETTMATRIYGQPDMDCSVKRMLTLTARAGEGTARKMPAAGLARAWRRRGRGRTTPTRVDRGIGGHRRIKESARRLSQLVLSGDARRNLRQKLARRKAWCLVANKWARVDESHLCTTEIGRAPVGRAAEIFTLNRGPRGRPPGIGPYSAACE
jgi:hypothetical protein